jgi:rod shape-determining protein MreD
MTKRDAVLIVLCVLLAFLAMSVEYVYLGGPGKPDLTLGLVCAVSWVCSWPVGLIAAFLVGVIEDIIIGRFVGISALSFLVAAMTMMGMRGPLNPDMVLSPAIAAVISAITSGLVSYAALLSFGTHIHWKFFLRGILYYDAIWSLIMIFPFYLLFRGVSRSLEKMWPESTNEKVGRSSYESRA